jgi:hypothetical protein
MPRYYFVDGKPAGPLVRRAFECCDALKALDRYEFVQARSVVEGLAEPKRALPRKIHRKLAEKPETVT